MRAFPFTRYMLGRHRPSGRRPLMGTSSRFAGFTSLLAARADAVISRVVSTIRCIDLRIPINVNTPLPGRFDARARIDDDFSAFLLRHIKRKYPAQMATA